MYDFRLAPWRLILNTRRMTLHFTCTECGGESLTAGVCQDEECVRHGKELISCDCTDGEHGADDDDDYHARG